MNVGAHVSAAGGLLPALDRGAAMGADSVQIFVQSPRAWKPIAHPPERLATYRERQATGPVTSTFCHATYLINLGTANTDLADKSQACLVENLVAATAIGSAGVVLHVGSHLGAGFDAVIRRVADVLVASLDEAERRAGEDSCPLLLENAAGAGGTIGRSFDELGRIIEATGDDQRLEACLDTQHLFASGVSFATIAEADRVVADFDEAIGLDRLTCFHLNESKVPFDSNRDRHDNFGVGLIGTDSLAALCSHPAFSQVPFVLEVPGTGDGPGADDIVTARRFITAGTRRRARADRSPSKRTPKKRAT